MKELRLVKEKELSDILSILSEKEKKIFPQKCLVCHCEIKKENDIGAIVPGSINFACKKFLCVTAILLKADINKNEQ